MLLFAVILMSDVLSSEIYVLFCQLVFYLVSHVYTFIPHSIILVSALPLTAHCDYIKLLLLIQPK